MTKKQIDYEKQYSDLRYYYEKKELHYEDLINLIIDARKERDKYKEIAKNHKKGNQEIAERIIKIGNHLDKAEKLCKLH